MLHIAFKRVYEPVESGDGIRVLVERLWPRGISKEKARIDYWAKEVAPSRELRSWYEHDVSKWPRFEEKYLAELRSNADAVSELYHYIKGKHVTFIYASRDEVHNSTQVLKDYMEHYKP